MVSIDRSPAAGSLHWAACEDERGHTEDCREGDREPGVNEVVAAAEAREVDRDRQRRDGRQPREERAPRRP